MSSRLEALEICRCPRCDGMLTCSAEDVRCGGCDRSVGRLWRGIVDFLAEATEIRIAAGATVDLRRDATMAAELARSEDVLDYDALVRRASVLQGGDAQAAPSNRASERYSRWYWTMEREVDLRHGEAMLAKLDAFLAERGFGAATGDVAIEAGGGTGRFLPGFAGRFKTVVFFDCSLSNIVLAQKLAAECDLTNVLFVRGNVERLPFRKDAFDFVHQNCVIEHVADPVAMVREALRVLSTRGTYLCLSPNRFPITLEPHFRLPLFGLFPAGLRRALLPHVRGLPDEAGTDLRSLRHLRRCFEAAGARPFIFFLPRTLSSTARNTPLRRIVKTVLSVPAVGSLLSYGLNGPLLPIMPYHVAVVHREG